MKQSKTIQNRKADYEFMDNRRNQNSAYKLLLQIAKERLWSKEGFLNEARTRGFMKTPQDMLIVRGVISKMNFGGGGVYNKRERYTPEQLKEMGEVQDVIPEERHLEQYKQLYKQL